MANINQDFDGVRLSEKKWGVQMRTKAKWIPWSYLAFAVAFLGLNIVGLTQGLGAGILGAQPQGAIINGNLWQSIANGAFLLAQGTAGLAIASAIPVIYTGTRHISMYHKYKKAQKFAYEKGKTFEGVNYDLQLQKTESIINSILPSSKTFSSALQNALKLREEQRTAPWYKKGFIREKRVREEDFIRLAIVKLTDRLAELTRLQNRGWRLYNLDSGNMVYTAKEISTREREMRMIQDFLTNVVNKVDEKDPFVTTLKSQIKKYKVDEVKKGQKLAGISLVPKSNDQDIKDYAETVNEHMVKGDVKTVIRLMYDMADNELKNIPNPATRSIGRMLGEINLMELQDARDQGNLYLQEIADNLAESIKLTGKHRTTNAELEETKENCARILYTLSNTLRNARKKKQNINKFTTEIETAKNKAIADLAEIGVKKNQAESTVQALINNITDAEEQARHSAEDAENHRRKAQSASDKTKNIFDKTQQKYNEEIANLKAKMSNEVAPILNYLNQIYANTQNMYPSIKSASRFANRLILNRTAINDAISQIMNGQAELKTIKAEIKKYFANLKATADAKLTTIYDKVEKEMNDKIDALLENGRLTLTNLEGWEQAAKASAESLNKSATSAKEDARKIAEIFAQLDRIKGNYPTIEAKLDAMEKSNTANYKLLRRDLKIVLDLIANFKTPNEISAEIEEKVEELRDEVKQISKAIYKSFNIEINNLTAKFTSALNAANKKIDDNNFDIEASYVMLKQEIDNLTAGMTEFAQENPNYGKRVATLETKLGTLEELVSHYGKDIKKIHKQINDLDFDNEASYVLLKDEIDNLTRNLHNLGTDNPYYATIIRGLVDMLRHLDDRLTATKSITPPSPEKQELKSKVDEIKSWARVIYHAVNENLTKIEKTKTSLANATKYINSKINGPVKKRQTSYDYSDEQVICETLNNLLKTSITDISKIATIDEANEILDKISKAVRKFNKSNNPISQITDGRKQ